ncbi:MAG: hypothetical protein JKY65_21465 [Planctomycetes bacterium]|nr:hypothetical protein [Planctomycetota bacterium]
MLGIVVGSTGQGTRPLRVLLLAESLVIEYQSVTVREDRSRVIAVDWSPSKGTFERLGAEPLLLRGVSLEFCQATAAEFEIPLSAT